MPAGTRIRANNVYGVISDNPLTAAATTFNSISLPLLPVVASAHAVVVFDPKRVYGDPEIVVVTVHTAASTVATIIRGQYGTSPRSHPQGTAWAHVPIDEDYIEVLTSSTRPTNPYEGQFIFETDTNKLVGFGGTDWAPRDAGGQLGYAQVTADQTGITTLVDLTGLTTTVTVGTGRRIKVLAQVALFNTSADVRLDVNIVEDGVIQQRGFVLISAASVTHSLVTSIIRSPSAGSHTYKLSAQVQGAGTMTLDAGADFPSFILVEDIGAA